MKSENFNVDFVVVGSQRCGTTWIDKALRSTGRILLPKNKQTYFFDRNYKLGLEWYKQQFETDDDVNYDLIGEVATGYCLDGAIELLAKDFPNTKIILAVREPVSRAYSNFIKRKSDYHGMNFEEALRSSNDLVKRGLYGEMLERILAYYPRDKVLIVFFDDLENSPARFINDILSFLQVDYNIDDSLIKQNVNSSLLEGPVKWAKKMNVYFLIKSIKFIGLTSFIRRIIFKLNKLKSRPPAISSAELHRLFDTSNMILQEVSGRDLSGWRK